MNEDNVVLLGDTHFGVRDGAVIMHNFFDKVYTDWFFEMCASRGVTAIYQLGDLFDKRKGVDSFSIAESQRYFFDQLAKYGITMHVLIGNHDAYFKDSIVVNSPDLLLSDYDNIWLYQRPMTITIGPVSVDIIPWICKENYKEVMDFVEASESELCFGHFEFAGFSMYKGVESHGGMSPTLFKKYRHVYSGHFHTRSTADNITYVGTPCELTWNDWNDPRGVHLLRGSDLEHVEFVPCPFTIFTKIIYNEDEADLKNLPDVKDKYVKLLVEKRTDFKKFDKYVTALNDIGVHELKIIEDLSDFNQENVDDTKLDMEDTPTMINGYIDEVDTDLDKDRLKREMNLLYVEAKALEV